MTDPLDALRAPITPVDPDPIFAARLRERLRRALQPESGGDMTETTETAQTTEPTTAAEQVAEDDLAWPPPP
jgi:hypothetical protein